MIRQKRKDVHARVAFPLKTQNSQYYWEASSLKDPNVPPALFEKQTSGSGRARRDLITKCRQAHSEVDRPQAWANFATASVHARRDSPAIEASELGSGVSHSPASSSPALVARVCVQPRHRTCARRRRQDRGGSCGAITTVAGAKAQIDRALWLARGGALAEQDHALAVGIDNVELVPGLTWREAQPQQVNVPDELLQ